MFRFIFWLLGLVVVISLLRGVIGIILKGLGQLVNPQSSPQGGQRPAGQVPLTGELKKDPACGTYISAATSLKETVGGETFYFCSKQCRDKYVASLAG
jgi:YHS domain-containing protein